MISLDMKIGWLMFLKTWRFKVYWFEFLQLMREDEATLGKITKPRRPKTVVLCPTRELSEQVLLLLLLLFSLFTKISCCSRTS